MREILWDRSEMGIKTYDYTTTHQLVSKEEDGFQAELAVAKVEEILQGWAKEIKNHCIVVALCTEPPNERNSDTARKGLVDL